MSLSTRQHAPPREHVHLTVADVGRALAFYRDVLGLQASGPPAGDERRRIAFLAPLPPHHRSTTYGSCDLGAALSVHITGHSQVAFGYTNSRALAQTVRRVHASGHRFRDREGAVLDWPTVGHDRITNVSVYMRDPDGNGVELFYDRPFQWWFCMAQSLAYFGNVPEDVTDLLTELQEATER